MELELARMQELTTKRTLKSMMRGRENYIVYPDLVDE